MNEDELAKAAVLLAHAPPDVPLPRHLERQILQHAPRAHSRATTTRAAAVDLDAPAPRRPSWLRELGPWLVAAACFAFGVFEWRSASLSRAERAQAAAPAAIRSTASLSTAGGARSASFEWSRAERLGRLTLDGQPTRTGAGPYEHLTLWARSEDGRALVLASSVCKDACADSTLAVTSSVPLREPMDIWMTAGPSDGKVDTQEPITLLSTRWPRDER